MAIQLVELQCLIFFFLKSFSGTFCLKLNLIGLDWIDLLDLFSMPFNTVFNTFALSSVSMIKNYLAHSLKTKFSGVFIENLECCIKVKATFKLKPDLMPIFWHKCPVTYATFDLVVKELNQLQQARVFQSKNYATWAVPIVMVKKVSRFFHRFKLLL